MTQHLDIRQRNNLQTGNELAAEIPSSSPDRRAFVTIHAYLVTDNHPGGARVSRILNRDPAPNLRFTLRRYEVETTFIKNAWDVCDEDLYHSVFKKGITSLDEPEAMLHEYLDDFALLDVSWRRDNPV